jgi:hypothetical protein
MLNVERKNVERKNVDNEKCGNGRMSNEGGKGESEGCDEKNNMS